MYDGSFSASNDRVMTNVFMNGHGNPDDVHVAAGGTADSVAGWPAYHQRGGRNKGISL